ncbi:S1 RNA-binding domain-containing protein [Streptomyces xanthophaeus]|uniref:S1 RNA-binding domain-containing protein n=1 Tax=Streptomyces xanthophaeus TaxID=67385 RepID=UPI00264829A3|nr:S1 RNA-binding domain-containing protein [Streptomyces xanthophaeus]WKD30913.1 S1 RNA-binding domain-containing protein [Streptomyces xanthophaeus]
MPPFTYRITPAAAVSFAVREQVAEAFVAAARRFALQAGIDRLTIDNPMARGFFSFRSRSAPSAPELAGLFPADRPGSSGPLPPSGYHDGARVPLDTGLELLRAMLLREGPWCRLHTEEGFFLHVGERHDLHVGGARPYTEAVAHARRSGLTVEPVERSPYDPALDETDPQPPADAAFWTAVHSLVAEHGGVLVEERYAGGDHRWHRPTTAAGITRVRALLTPRARLAVWPDLTDDIEAVRAAVLRSERLELLVQQDPDGSMRWSRIAEPWMGRTDHAHPMIRAGAHRRAGLVPLAPADRRPLLAGVLPDADGVVRARWRTNRTPADERRALLGSLRTGDVVTGTVVSGLDDVGVHVDLDLDLDLDLDHEWQRPMGFLRVPEMSWEYFEDVAEVAPIGRRIRAEVLHVDLEWERASLSVKALVPDPWRSFAEALRSGDTVPGTVTKIIPFGAFVRIAPGVEGLVHESEFSGRTFEAGDDVRVTLLAVDLERRRISLSPATEA